MDKKKGHPKGQPISSIARIDDISSVAQCKRMISALRHGPVTTISAMRDLNIIRPSARISDLRRKGYLIDTRLGPLTDEHGREHPRMATYSLRAATSSAIAA